MGTRELEERVDDHVSISIVKKFAKLSNPSSEFCIFRMYDRVRKINKKAYEPSIVAIGPYHHGKAHLQEMELHKLRFLRRFLSRRNETTVNRHVMAIRELEDRARKCYAETTGLVLDRDSNKFVEMMLLDGFFIIELFWISKMFQLVGENQQILKSGVSVEELRHENFHIFQAVVGILQAENDLIFESYEILSAIRRDLILLENQLPFFILNRLFDMTNSDSNLGIIQIAADFLKNSAAWNKFQAPSGIPIDNINHLLDLVHNCWCSKFAETNRNVTREKWEFISSATELQEAGVQFKKAEASNLFDIKFISGTIEIPPLLITDYTESFLTNLVAFELCPSYQKPRYVCDYIVFMDRLINSSKDVRLLNHSGIIESWVGDDAEVYSMWHKLFKITLTDLNDFGYSEVFINVNNHCKRRRNVWMANLKRNYFNSPWASISFLAATILLLLTVAQTVFSILSFGKGSF